VGTPDEVTPLRAVLDTNVALSALLFAHGRLAWLRQAWQQGIVVPLLSRTTAHELVRVLAYPKFQLTADEQQELLAEYLPYCEIVVGGSKQDQPSRLVRDPDDLAFLQLALAGNAGYLVTGDGDLLALQGATPIAIVTPEQLRGVLSG
jgi:uncharacterized protein